MTDWCGIGVKQASAVALICQNKRSGKKAPSMA